MYVWPGEWGQSCGQIWLFHADLLKQTPSHTRCPSFSYFSPSPWPLSLLLSVFFILCFFPSILWTLQRLIKYVSSGEKKTIDVFLMISMVLPLSTGVWVGGWCVWVKREDLTGQDKLLCRQNLDRSLCVEVGIHTLRWFTWSVSMAGCRGALKICIKINLLLILNSNIFPLIFSTSVI